MEAEQRKRETSFSLSRRQETKDQQIHSLSHCLDFSSQTSSMLMIVYSTQVWTFGDMSLSSGSSGRFSVQTVTSDHGVSSSLVLSETLAQDFQMRYNCTAWNRFGTGTALVTLKEQGTH